MLPRHDGARGDSLIRFFGMWGQFVEGLIAPRAVAMFQERGIKIDSVFSKDKISQKWR